MKRSLGVLVVLMAVLWNVGCSSSAKTEAVAVTVSGSFTTVEVGSPAVTLTAKVVGDPKNSGVKWQLTAANTSCSPACGKLSVSAGSGSTAVYTPPTAIPLNQTATITALAMSDTSQIYAFNFVITPPISVSITGKFTSQVATGPAVALTATVTNDVTNAGVNWTLMAGGSACSPACGTLVPSAAPSLAASYTPPSTPPTGANANPTIQAASVADPSKTDSFSFTIGAPPISVTINNKFSTQVIGSPGVTVTAVITNDFTNAGLTWTLTAGGSACSPTCGTLAPAAAPALTATYTPPTSLPTGANVNPSITTTSVADTTKSDSFSFNIVTAGNLFSGSYAFQLRGYDSASATVPLAPMAMAGSMLSDGQGNITGGELDLNDNGTATQVTGLSGTYTIDTSFNGIPRITANITAGSNTLVLKCVLSGDGTRGKVIELDASQRLNAGTILRQDPTALSAANPAGSYAFLLDSDLANYNGNTRRIVEAGQLVIGSGGTSVTGGVADAGQAGQTGFLLGGLTPATISAGAATAPDSSGRGTLTVTINGNSNTYAYYIVDAQQLNLLETDTGGVWGTLQSGQAQLQNTLTASSINTTSVVALTGAVLKSGSPSPAVEIGLLTITGGTTAAVNFESNTGGNANVQQVPQTATGSVYKGMFDPTTGRALLLSTFFTSGAVYLYDTGKGFLIDISSSGCLGYSGEIIPQAAGPFSNADLTGNSIGVAGGSSSPSIPNLDFAINFAPSTNSSNLNYSTLVDYTDETGRQVPSYSLTGTGQVQEQTLGWGRISFTPGVFGDFSGTSSTVLASFYLIGPNQFVAIGQGENGGAGVQPSGVMYFDPY